MAGILDKKTRILDTTITSVGRAQVPFGRLRFEYATFTDRHASYAITGSLTGTLDVAEDISDRLYFEAPSARFQDQICLEVAEDGAFIMSGPWWVKNEPTGKDEDPIENSFINEDGQVVLEGVFAKSADLTLTGSSLAAQSKNNFKDLQIINDDSSIFAGSSFEISETEFKFSITDNMVKSDNPFTNQKTQGLRTQEHLSNLYPLHLDERFRSVPNFMYLPPINKLPAGVSLKSVYPFTLVDAITVQQTSVGNFKLSDLKDIIADTPEFREFGHASPEPPWMSISSWTGAFGDTRPLRSQISVDELTLIDVAAASKCVMRAGARGLYGYVNYVTAHNTGDVFTQLMKGLNQSLGRKVTFNKTSDDNNLFIQLFEVGDSGFRKLSVIDYGWFESEDPHKIGSRVFFVGKMYWDKGQHMLKFANIFTMIFK